MSNLLIQVKYGDSASAVGGVAGNTTGRVSIRDENTGQLRFRGLLVSTADGGASYPVVAGHPLLVRVQRKSELLNITYNGVTANVSGPAALRVSTTSGIEVLDPADYGRFK